MKRKASRQQRKTPVRFGPMVLCHSSRATTTRTAPSTRSHWGRERVAAGAVDEQVEAAPAVEGRCEERPDGVLVDDVGDGADHVSAALLDIGHNLGEAGGVGVDHGDVRAVGGVLASDGFTDSGCCARDDSDFASQRGAALGEVVGFQNLSPFESKASEEAFEEFSTAKHKSMNFRKGRFFRMKPTELTPMPGTRPEFRVENVPLEAITSANFLRLCIANRNNIRHC